MKLLNVHSNNQGARKETKGREACCDSDWQSDPKEGSSGQAHCTYSGAIHQQPTKAVLGQGSIPVFTIYFPLQDTVSSTIPQETSDKILNRIKKEEREKFLAGLKSSSQNVSEHKPK